MQDAIQ